MMCLTADVAWLVQREIEHNTVWQLYFPFVLSKRPSIFRITTKSDIGSIILERRRISSIGHVVKKYCTMYSIGLKDQAVYPTAFSYCGRAIAANMPIIKTTTNNSIKLNAAFFFIFIQKGIKKKRRKEKPFQQNKQIVNSYFPEII